MTRIIVTPHARTLKAPGSNAGGALAGGRPLGLLDDDDAPWLDALIGVVANLAGQPWRVALDAIDAGGWMPQARTQDRHGVGGGAAAGREVSVRRLAAAVHALRKLLAGGAHDIALARRARSLVLGAPALTDEARDGRLAAAGSILDLSVAELEQILWADLPRERPIDLRAGRPHAHDLAAHANVGLVQRALRRAHSVELRLRGDPAAMLRGCAANGLLVAVRREHGETVLEIVGPLALCHGTTVYGRALGNLVPLLGACAEFTLGIHAEARGQAYELAVASPALLPAAPLPRVWRLVERLARDLERLGIAVIRTPPAIAAGGALACPDLGIAASSGTTWIELVGFWTPEYLARKLARYQAAGAGPVVLCVDATRACDDDDPPPGACVVRYERRVHAEALAQLLGLDKTKPG